MAAAAPTRSTAGAINQTLTGGAGADTLIGFSGGFDTFKDTAANLNGDTIQNFVASDTIDLTNLAYATTDKVTTADEWHQHEGHGYSGHDQVHVHPGRFVYVLWLPPRVRRCGGHVLDAYLSDAMPGWLHGVELEFSRSGKPTDNAFAVP